MKSVPLCNWRKPSDDDLRSRCASEGKGQLDICIDRRKLLFLLNQRLLLAEDFRCLDLGSKRRVKRLLLRSLTYRRER